LRWLVDGGRVVLGSKILVLNKSFSLVLIAVVFSGLIFSVNVVVHAESSIPKPSVPQFTIETVDSSYDVPPITSSSTNPYTGEVTTTTTPGYLAENITTILKIVNQPFTPYQIQQNDDSFTINLFYNIQIKGHYVKDWTNYRYNNGSSDRNLSQDYNSQFTIVKIDEYLPGEGKVDFRVQALEGYQRGVNVYPGVPGQHWMIIGSASDWSNIQTITFPTTSKSTSTSPPDSTSTPVNTDSDTFVSDSAQLIIVAITVAVLATVFVSVLLYIKRLKHA